MRFFKEFAPIGEISPIHTAIHYGEKIKANPLQQKIYEEIIALPDEERALMADLMRALPELSRKYVDRGVGPRLRLEEFIHDPDRRRILDNMMRRDLFSDEKIADIGRAIYIPDLDEPIIRDQLFGKHSSTK